MGDALSAYSPRGIAALVLALLAPIGACTSAEVVIAQQQCRYGTSQDSEFRVFANDAITCDYRHAGLVRLRIVSVDIERYCERVPRPCERKFPLPKIVDPNGREIGRLPTNFPGEAAVSYEIRLSDINDGWPAAIRMHGTSIGVGSAPTWSPLIWNSNTGRFEGGARR